MPDKDDEKVEKEQVALESKIAKLEADLAAAKAQVQPKSGTITANAAGEVVSG